MEDRNKGIKDLFKEVIAENHLNLGNKPDDLNQEAKSAPNKIISDRHTPRHHNKTVENQNQAPNTKDIRNIMYK